MVDTTSNPRCSARRIHSSIVEPRTPALPFGKPIPIFMTIPF
jgi:hypothetical protein